MVSTTVIPCEYSVEGSGPALILIHGIGAARNTWSKALPLLKKHFTVVTYDLRGHGVSPMPNGEFTLDDLVEDLELVRSRCNIDKAHIAGHSLGGMIGPAYAHRYPQHVLSLGLLSTAAFRTDEDSRKVMSVVLAMEKNGIPEILETLTDRWFTDSFIATHPEVIAARLQQVINTDPNIFLNVFRIYATTEMAPWIHEITHPCLVLTGEHDGGCNPRLNRLIAEALTDSTLQILPGYKHSLMLECGDLVAERLIEFIQSQ
ncbi:alpha/beta hydrolase [Chromatiales bacterium (ex Bugula neritina AB1)]|nr:alpha/beta hydrolase [Chromatiales bacterium (ex Bugula neritina AB1)]